MTKCHVYDSNYMCPGINVQNLRNEDWFNQYASFLEMPSGGEVKGRVSKKIFFLNMTHMTKKSVGIVKKLGVRT